MARHQRLTHDTGVNVFFAHPHNPWQRGTNDNTNRLIRRYLPKETPITKVELRPGTWTRLMVAVMRLAGGPDLGILPGSGP